MPESTPEPANLTLELLRGIRAEMAAMRAETSARFDKVDGQFAQIDSAIADLKREIRGFQRNTIAEIYKANLTVDRFIGLESRVEELERRLS